MDRSPADLADALRRLTAATSCASKQVADLSSTLVEVSDAAAALEARMRRAERDRLHDLIADAEAAGRPYDEVTTLAVRFQRLVAGGAQ